METTVGDHFKSVMARLKREEFLLESDPQLPSVCTLISGEPMKGSWWSHPMAQVIFAVNERLEDHPDVLITKLVSGKVTFVHRKLWPEIFVIGTAREPWQLRNLSELAQRILKRVDEEGSVSTENLSALSSGKRKVGDATRELEKKLLINAAQVHTPGGAHAKILQTWPNWSVNVKLENRQISTAAAMKTLEGRIAKQNQEFVANAKLPWQ